MPNIMIPLVSCAKEFESQAHVIRATAATVFAEKGDSVDYKVGVSAFVCARACAHVRMHGHDAWRLLLAPTLINASHLCSVYAMAVVARDRTYQVGALVEIPRACLIAGQVAKSADFFSFGERPKPPDAAHPLFSALPSCLCATDS